MNMIRTVLIATLLTPGCAFAAQQNDLREFRVGMPVSDLPGSGYTGFSCADDPAHKLSSWNDYKACPAQSDGSHAVGFRYGDSSGDEDGTRVGGQPVSLALLIDDDSMVTGIRIETDPHAHLYLHKRAFLFALQVKARFGENGWTCHQMEPTATEQPIGGVFVHEHCEKTTPSRHFVLDRQLYHDPSKDLRTFTDATQVTIGRPG